MSPRRCPDVEFRATARARRLRFDEVPDVRVELTGDQDDASSSGSERVHLPRPVRRHETYEDIRVDHAILSWLAVPDDPRGARDAPLRGPGGGPGATRTGSSRRTSR